MGKFPSDFIWGTATSAYQIEGAWLANGRGLSIWDIFAHTPGRTSRGDTGDTACDHYNRVEEDVALLKALGVNAYRFSIAWPRILPAGRGTINLAGIEFYNRLIDCLLEHGIEPWVTLYHWDLPAALQNEMDGWLNPDIAACFREYAGVCFAAFGDRVKRWITINEGWVVALLGYGTAQMAPGRASLTEPYLVGHNLLRAHAFAVDLYRTNFQPAQRGMIGMTNNCDFRLPASANRCDLEAAQRSIEFFLGWFADPLYFGDYPESMRSRLGDRLPRFTSAESALLQGSQDFFGLNHYFTELAADNSAGQVKIVPQILNDSGVVLSSRPDWEKTAMGWSVVPEGLYRLLKWVHERYQGPEIYVTENGCAIDEPTAESALNDQKRIDFLSGYIESCSQALAEGVKLRGYFVWSLMDNYEWSMGYDKRFGLYYVDYETLERIPKGSAKWYRDHIERARG